MSNFYVKKGDKAFGPLAWERLESMAQTGKIGATSSVSTSAKGPWRPFSELRAEMASSVSQSPDQSGGNFPQGFPMDQIQAPAATQLPPSSIWKAPSAVARESRTTDSSEIEEQEASFFVRIFLPWAGENSQTRYGNLDRYMKIARFITRLFFIFGLIYLILSEVVLIVGFLFRGWEFFVEFGLLGFVFAAVFLFIANLIAVFFYLLLLHLFYIASMALCDFVRLAMDVEANTRRKA